MTLNFKPRADYDEKKRIIKQEHVTYKGVEYFISTVDLGIAYDGELYWETMIFIKDDWGDLYCDRYKSRQEAIDGHEMAKAQLLKGELFEEEKAEDWF